MMKTMATARGRVLICLAVIIGISAALTALGDPQRAHKSRQRPNHEAEEDAGGAATGVPVIEQVASDGQSRPSTTGPPPTYVGYMNQNGEKGGTLNTLTVGDYWAWTQETVCSFPNASVLMFGSHQASYAPRRSLLYKGIMYGGDQNIVKVRVDKATWKFDCKVLQVKLPVDAGEYRMDIFPDQAPEDPKPTIVGALDGTPSHSYILYELLNEDSERPELKQLMEVPLKHAVQQIFGSYYDSETMTEYIGFNEGHLFWDVPPCWLLVIDVKNKKVLKATYYEHESGYDIWYDRALKSFFVITMDDCAVNKTSCIQGVRRWDPMGSGAGEEGGLGPVQSNMCIQGTACFSFEVGYGYAYNPSNHTAVLYGGVSGWWHYDVTTRVQDQYEYSTVFLTNAVYVGPQ